MIVLCDVLFLALLGGEKRIVFLEVGVHKVLYFIHSLGVGHRAFVRGFGDLSLYGGEEGLGQGIVDLVEVGWIYRRVDR